VNWNLELVFVEGGKVENPEKNPQSKGEKNIIKTFKTILNQIVWLRASELSINTL
jgi:hypothetical protein